MAGAKPCMLFNGHCWDQEVDFRNLKSMFMDFFRGPVVEMVNLGMSTHAFLAANQLTRMVAGMDRVMSFTADEDRIILTQYRILYKKSGSRLPLVEVGLGQVVTCCRCRPTLRFAAEGMWTGY
jgi:ribosome production factor 2